MLSEKDTFLWQEHYRDLLREAERERMMRQVLGPRKALRFQGRALRRLERYLDAWGCLLQKRDVFGVFDGKVVAFPGATVITSDSGCV